MQSEIKVSDIEENFSLIIIKNRSLLKSIKDYFYEMLLHDLIKESFCIEKQELTKCLETQVTNKFAIVIEEGVFFTNHIDNDFLRKTVKDFNQYSLIGNLLNNNSKLESNTFILNLHDWKQVGSPDFLLYERDFGNKVIDVLLKNNFKIRSFNDYENQSKTFLYYSKKDQVTNLLSWESIPPKSYYYPVATNVRKNEFSKFYPNYISVANGVESLRKIKNVYQSIKHITYYDISMPALIFTELLLTDFEADYKKFVEHFENTLGGRPWTTLHVDAHGYKQVDQYIKDIDEVMPVIEHIRNNDITVDYCYGDITRLSVLKNINTDTLIHLSNVFEYSHNHIRKGEKNHWHTIAMQHQNKFEILF